VSAQPISRDHAGSLTSRASLNRSACGATRTREWRCRPRVTPLRSSRRSSSSRHCA